MQPRKPMVLFSLVLLICGAGLAYAMASKAIGLIGGGTAPIKLSDGSYIGEIRMFATDNGPITGWLECDGSVLPVNATYQQLFNVIGNRFGGGVPNSFRLPDLRGIFPRGWNHGKTAAQEGFFDPDAGSRTVFNGGPDYSASSLRNDQVGTYQQDALQVHQHSDSGHSHSLPDAFAYREGIGGGGGYGAWSVPQGAPVPPSVKTGYANIGSPTGARVGGETRASNVSVMFYIRYQ